MTSSERRMAGGGEWLAPLLWLVMMFAMLHKGQSSIEPIPLPEPIHNCYSRYANVSLSRYVGKRITWYCDRPGGYNKNSRTKLSISQSALNYTTYLYGQVLGPSRRRCVRREYRRLTDQERRDFHTAINLLKTDTSVQPNIYDVLASYHNLSIVFLAHFGPNFLSWHRYYLLMLERALQEKVSGVCLPYWDNTLDNELDDPSQSNMWTQEFLGDGDGELDYGPFAGWTFNNTSPLIREVGGFPDLMSREVVETILAQDSYEDILPPTAPFVQDLEGEHGLTHIFVGGDMSGLDTSSRDPAFFLHHCYIDYLWDSFRANMRAKGGDPEIYPAVFGDPLQAPDAPMGFGNLTCADGYKEYLRDSYEYEPSPTCSVSKPDCGTPYLRCNLTSYRCYPVLPPPPTQSPETCPDKTKTPYPYPFQNSYCVDGECDVNKMVILPIQIFMTRPPEYTEYPSYPVRRGRVDKSEDVYTSLDSTSSSRLSSLYAPDRRRYPKRCSRCNTVSGAGQVVVSSLGLNYRGYHQEAALVDRRQPLSPAVAYVAVKDPGQGVTEVLLRVHESCGRICRPACRLPGSGYPPVYQNCTGAIRLNASLPRSYGSSYGDATLEVLSYSQSPSYPTYNADNFAVSFFCDYSDRLPWVNTPKTLEEEPARSTRRSISTTTPPATTKQAVCRVSDKCSLSGPCYGPSASSCKTGSTRPCSGSCRYFAFCQAGRYVQASCSNRQRYDVTAGMCVTGMC